MPHIRFYCVICGTSMQASAESANDIVECPNCARVVPVPKLTSLSGQMTGCAPVFPPEVLDIEVKFLCTACNNRLRADARWEGRSVICPVCTEKTRVPRWSSVAQWSRLPDGNPPPARGVGASPEAAAVSLSLEEIEFLSQATPPGKGTGSDSKLP